MCIYLKPTDRRSRDILFLKQCIKINYSICLSSPESPLSIVQEALLLYSNVLKQNLV